MSCSLITDSLHGLQQETQEPPLPCIQPTCQGQKMYVSFGSDMGTWERELASYSFGMYLWDYLGVNV